PCKVLTRPCPQDVRESVRSRPCRSGQGCEGRSSPRHRQDVPRRSWPRTRRVHGQAVPRYQRRSRRPPYLLTFGRRVSRHEPQVEFPLQPRRPHHRKDSEMPLGSTRVRVVPDQVGGGVSDLLADYPVVIRPGLSPGPAGEEHLPLGGNEYEVGVRLLGFQVAPPVANGHFQDLVAVHTGSLVVVWCGCLTGTSTALRGALRGLYGLLLNRSRGHLVGDPHSLVPRAKQTLPELIGDPNTDSVRGDQSHQLLAEASL